MKTDNAFSDSIKRFNSTPYKHGTFPLYPSKQKCLYPECEKDRDDIAFCAKHSEEHKQHCKADRQGWGIKTW